MYRTMLTVLLLLPVVFVASLFTAALGNPFFCDDAANTCTYRATVKEPTKTVGGSPLTNYKQSNIKASINGGTFTISIKPATSVNGGGTVTQDYTFATTACAVTTLSVKASGTNTLNTEGPETAVATVQRDRTADPTCAPAAPSLTLD